MEKPNEDMEIDSVSEISEAPEEELGEDEFEDGEFEEDDYDYEDSEDELFRENPLKAIWLKLKEITE